MELGEAILPQLVTQVINLRNVLNSWAVEVPSNVECNAGSGSPNSDDVNSIEGALRY